MNAQLKALLAKKNIDPALFLELKVERKEDSSSIDINKTCQTFYTNIYSRPYLRDNLSEDLIKRKLHGIQHVARVSCYVPVFANLYRRYVNDKDLTLPHFGNLNEEALQLLTIAALFHDAARENEDVDLWDQESALLCFYYLKDVLKVSHEKAALIAEAIANKDQENGVYYKLVSQKSGGFEWRKEKRAEKNILQQILHDADSQDIIRARDRFDGTYLDFYQKYGKKNQQALDEMATVITEARGWIEEQGDGRKSSNMLQKQPYNTEQAYLVQKDSLKKGRFPLLARLYADGKLLAADALRQTLLNTTPYDAKQDITEENLQAAARTGNLFSRSIISPTGIREKITRPELNAQTEIYKVYRRKGIRTRTSKKDALEKEGNPARSLSMLGWGAVPYSSVGFLLVNPDSKRFTSISAVDSDTGRGKKKAQGGLSLVSEAENRAKLDDVLLSNKLGGSARSDGLAHSEMQYHVMHYDAIYFTGESDEKNTFSTILQALYLQQEHEKMTAHIEEKGLTKKLPIFQYSPAFNTFKRIDTELNDEKIIALWVEACSRYLEREYIMPDTTLEQIKIRSLNITGKSPDIHYPPKLLAEINARIEKMRAEKIAHQIALLEKEIKTNPSFILLEQGKKSFEMIMRIPSKDFPESIKAIMHQEIKEANQSSFKKNTLPSRAYLLAKKLELQEEMPAIQKQSQKVLQELLQDRITSASRGVSGWVDVRKHAIVSERQGFSGWLDSVAHFDLHPQMKKEIQAYIAAIFAQIQKKMDAPKEQKVNIGNFDLELDWINYCIEEKIPLDEKMKAIAAAVIDGCEQSILREADFHSIQVYSESMIQFLRIANATDFPKIRLRQTLEEYILKSYFPTNAHHSTDHPPEIIRLLPLLQQAGLLADERIFSAMLSRIGTMNVSNFDHFIMRLKECMPDGIFTEKQMALISTRRELFASFFQNEPDRFIQACAEEKGPIHTIFQESIWESIADDEFRPTRTFNFLTPFLLSEKFIREGKILGISAEQEAALSDLLLKQLTYDIWPGGSHLVSQCLGAFTPTLTFRSVIFWSKTAPNPEYKKNMLLFGLLIYKRNVLSKTQYHEFLDNFISNPLIQANTDKVFKDNFKKWYEYATGKKFVQSHAVHHPN